MRGRPCRREILGSHPSSCLARVMSGLRLWGSSSVLGRNSIFAFGSMASCTTLASSSMVNSPGLPKLNGPMCSPSISRIRPSTCFTLQIELKQHIIKLSQEIHYSLTLQFQQKTNTVYENTRPSDTNISISLALHSHRFFCTNNLKSKIKKMLSPL